MSDVNMMADWLYMGSQKRGVDPSAIEEEFWEKGKGQGEAEARRERRWKKGAERPGAMEKVEREGMRE